MNITHEIKDRIDLAFLAIGGRANALNHCQCVPEVNMVPCQTCAIYDALVDAESLLKAVAKMSNRRCRACGHVGYYLDATIPNCLCEQCGSADTRLIRNTINESGATATRCEISPEKAHPESRDH